MTNLPKGERLLLRQTAGRTLRVHAGHVWLTEPACIQDVTLGSGESFHLSGSGIAVLEALSDATLSIEP